MYKLNYFNFEKRDNNYLITNDLGKFEFLSNEEFNKLIKKQPLSENVEKNLINKRFIYSDSNEIFAQNSYEGVRRQKEYLFTPTCLHIFVVTKNCNFNCVYCQAGNLSQNKKLCIFYNRYIKEVIKMYYYGNNGYYPAYGQTQTPCCGGTYGGYTTGYGMGAAIWIVLFILLVIIIGAWGFGNQGPNN